VKPEEGKE